MQVRCTRNSYVSRSIHIIHKGVEAKITKNKSYFTPYNFYYDARVSLYRTKSQIKSQKHKVVRASKAVNDVKQ